MTVATRTTTVVLTTSLRFGHVTFFISAVVSRTNSLVAVHHSLGRSTSPVFSSIKSFSQTWQAKRGSNPQPAVLETAALPIELLAFDRRQKPDNTGFLCLIPILSSRAASTARDPLRACAMGSFGCLRGLRMTLRLRPSGHFVSRCNVRFRSCRQYFFSSSFSVMVFLFLVVE